MTDGRTQISTTQENRVLQKQGGLAILLTFAARVCQKMLAFCQCRQAAFAEAHFETFIRNIVGHLIQRSSKETVQLDRNELISRVRQADQEIYAAHAINLRPNPLYGAQGNRLPHSATYSAHAEPQSARFDLDAWHNGETEFRKGCSWQKAWSNA